ncbi:MAG: hypothetical protein C0412_12845, partial [Flavobacterium sp.]|nr:hypothetical protein [Flavobacterium sp.]
IKVDIYDNARGVKIESATTPFKVSEVSALLNSIRACRTVYLDGQPIVFGNGTEDATLIYGAIHIDITWTGLTSFTGRYDQETSTSHNTRIVNGSVSLDGQFVSIQWDDKETGLGEFSWYLNQTIVNLTNVPLSSNRDNDSIAQYELHNSTSFTGSYRRTAMTSDHTLKVNSIPRPSNIKFKFGLY